MKLLRTLLVGGLPLAVIGACAGEDPPPPAITTSAGPAVTSDTAVNSVTNNTVTSNTAATVTSNTAAVTSTATTVTSNTASVTSTTGTSGGTDTSTSTSTSAGGGASTATTTDAGTMTSGGGNMGATMTATTGAVGPTLPELVGSLDGRLVMTPCGDTPNTDDCDVAGWVTDGQSTDCVNDRLDANIDHPIGGTEGATYMLTLHFYGVNEPKVYGSGVDREADNRPDLNGGDPLPWATAEPNHEYPSSDYNTYEIRVEDPAGDEVGVYYLNADTQEGHFTMLIDYEKTIPVIGGGNIHLRIYDANCRQIKNCGTSAGAPCGNKARSVDISGADPQPQGLQQPGLGQTADHAGQWLLIDAIGFTEG